MTALRVCVDARILGGTSGGLESVIVGLASALSKLEVGAEQYLFLTYRDSSDWLRGFISGPCEILEASPPVEFRLKRLYRRYFSVIRRDQLTVMNRISGKFGSSTQGVSDGTIEEAGIDLMHFVRQQAFLTKVPSIYHPHDLLHMHYPETFTRKELDQRNQEYRLFCNAAQVVAVTSSWVRRDVIRRLAVPENKVRVIPWAPVVSEYPAPDMDDLANVKSKFGLPRDFFFYPAQTWPHKNHEGLLNALAILRDDYGMSTSLVTSGGLTEHYPTLARRVSDLDLQERVQFLGYVSPLELRALYRLSRAVVVPTLFEAASGPVWEGFFEGVPVACSSVTSLPEQVGNAALLFDPQNPHEIAFDMKLIHEDESLRQKLVARGRERVGFFTWERTARHFRAQYRELAHRPLSGEDRQLLQETPPI